MLKHNLRTWFRPQFSLRTLFILFVLLGAVFSYTGSYVARSLHGRYEPAVIGLGGVKWYDWAPAGFVTDFRWNASAARFYYPLWRLDRMFWHQPIHASKQTGTHPINEVAPEDIGRVYNAWWSK